MLYQWLYTWAGTCRQKLLFYSHQSSFRHTRCAHIFFLYEWLPTLCSSKSFSLSKSISHHMTSSFISEVARTNSIMVGRRTFHTTPSNSQVILFPQLHQVIVGYQLGILQFSSILTLPRDRFPRLKAQSYKTSPCFIQIPTASFSSIVIDWRFQQSLPWVWLICYSSSQNSEKLTGSPVCYKGI